MKGFLTGVCVCYTAVVTAAVSLPVELGFEYRNGLTLKELSEIEGSHVLNSCDDPSVYATADHSPMSGYSGKHGHPGSFMSVGSYFFQITTRIESDWYDIAVEKDANGQPGEGVSLAEGKSLYIDFLANLTTFDDDPTISFQQTLQVANSLNAIRLVARQGCIVSIDRNLYLYRHEVLDRNDEPVATNWCVVAADRTGATPVRRMWELTHVDGSAFPANEDGFDRITVQAARPKGAASLVYSVFINGQPTAAGGKTAFSSLNTGFAAPTAVRVIGFSGRAKVDDFVITETPPAFVEGTRVEKGCFKVLPGDLPHVAYDQCPDVDLAVEKYGKEGWKVCFHGYVPGYAVAVNGGELVGKALFNGSTYEATGSGDVFTFAFHYDPSGVENPRYEYEYWGWVTLGTDLGCNLVVVDSAVCETPDVLIVPSYGEPQDIPQVFDWRYADYGDWIELRERCIPEGAKGRVTIPERINGKPVLSIGERAFYGCSSITGVDIPNTVSNIGFNAFGECRSLRGITIPASVTNVGEYAFHGIGEGKADIGGGVRVIRSQSFASSGLTDVVLHLGTEVIEREAFAGDSSLTSVTIPVSVSRIETWAFVATGLKSVTVPWATEVEPDAFPSDCKVVRGGTGLTFTAFPEPDDDTKIALMRMLDWHDYASKQYVFFDRDTAGGVEYPFNVVYVCAHLGISPSRIYDSSTPIWMEALYKMPTVRVEGIDPERGVITGRVVPAEGTRIVAPPLERAFGFDQVIDFGMSARYDKEWGHALRNREEGFALDLSDYQRSNGLFRVTYPKWIIDCRDDGQYQDTFFKIHLRDYEQGLW